MDNNVIGKAISYLRKRAGFTQKDLAERIGISDKAVSKWERGLGLPDITYLRKLSILLDTDTDSLLAGDVVHHDSSWQGIIVLDDNPYGIGAETIIYDKPLVYFLLSYYLLVGIKDILVVGSENDKRFVEESLGDGSQFGIKLKVYVGELCDAISSKKWENGNVMMVYGRCLLYGVDQTRFFQKAMMNRDRFTMLVLPKKIGKQVNRLFIDQNKKVINSNSDEPLRTQYEFSDIPIVFFPTYLLKDLAKTNSIKSYLEDYVAKNDIYVQVLDRGFVEIEVDNWDNVQEASLFMKIVQDKCGMVVYCLEEVAWRRGLINLKQLKNMGDNLKGTEYGDYILSLYERVEIQNKS